MQRWVGVLLISAGIVGIISTPVRPRSQPPLPTAQVVVALRDLPSGTALQADDPQLATLYLASRPVPVSAVLPGALRDLHLGQTINLLADVKAGQEVVNYSIDEPPPRY